MQFEIQSVLSFLRYFALSHDKPIKKDNNYLFIKKKKLSLQLVELEQELQFVIVELQLLQV